MNRGKAEVGEVEVDLRESTKKSIKVSTKSIGMIDII